MRRLPAEGEEVTVVYLAVRERAIVEAVQDAGRRVSVVTEEGALLHFHLARASAHFITSDGSARLMLG